MFYSVSLCKLRHLRIGFLRLLLGVGLTQLALLATGVLVARALGPTGRGDVATAMLVVTLFSFLASNSTASLANLYTSKGALAKRVVGRVARSILPMVLCAGTACFFLLLALGTPSVLSLACAASVFVLALNPALVGTLTGAKCFFRAAISQSSASVFYAITLLFIIVLSQVTFELVVWAWLASNLAALGLGLLLLQRTDATSVQQHSFRMRSAAAIRRRGLRGLFSVHSPLESFRLDQMVVFAVASSAGLGLYVAALSLANLPKLLGHTMGTLVAGALTSKRRSPAIVWSVLGPVSAGVLMAGISGPAIELLYGEEFRAAASLSFWLCLAGGLMGARKILNEALRFSKRDGAASLSEVIATVVFLAVVVMSYESLRLDGVALALFAGAFFSCLMGLMTLLHQRKQSDYSVEGRS